MQSEPRLGEAFDVFQNRPGTVAHLRLSTDERFASDDPVGVGGPLRALTLRGASFLCKARKGLSAVPEPEATTRADRTPTAPMFCHDSPSASPGATGCSFSLLRSP